MQLSTEIILIFFITKKCLSIFSAETFYNNWLPKDCFNFAETVTFPGRKKITTNKIALSLLKDFADPLYSCSSFLRSTASRFWVLYQRSFLRTFQFSILIFKSTIQRCIKNSEKTSVLVVWQERWMHL